MRERLPEVERITDRGIERSAETAERQVTVQSAEAKRHTASAGKLQEEKALRSRMAAQAPAQHAAEAQQEYRHEPPSQGSSGTLLRTVNHPTSALR